LGKVIDEGGNISAKQLAKKVCALWNREHLELLGRGASKGLGGILEYNTAFSYLTEMNNAAFAITGNAPRGMSGHHQPTASVDNVQTLLPLQSPLPALKNDSVMPPPLLQWDPAAPANRAALASQAARAKAATKVVPAKSPTKVKKGRPKKNPNGLKPFELLTLEEADNLTRRELQVYTNYLVGKVPCKKMKLWRLSRNIFIGEGINNCI